MLKSLKLGGAERQAILLARLLNEKENFDTEVWALTRDHSDVQIAELCERYQIPWRAVAFHLHGRPLKLLRDLTRLAVQLRHAQPAAIISYVNVPNIACGLVWRLTGAQTHIWSQRASYMIEKHKRRRITRLAIRQTPLFIANSHTGAKFLLQELGVKSDRIRVIQNGVELPAPSSDRSTWFSRLGLDNKRDYLLVCMVASFREEKDHETLLRAWSRAIRRLSSGNDDVKLLLAGRKDRTFDKIYTLVAELELHESVAFLGHVSDVSGLLSIVDIGILSSHTEGSPNAVLEYMMAGLPVVATDIGGIKEAVGDAYPYLSPPGDIIKMSDHIIQFATRPELRARVGAANRQRAQSEFSTQKLATVMRDLLYCELSRS